MCRHWFDDIKPVDLDGGTLRLLVNEPVQKKYLERSCINQFNEAAQAVTDRLLAVRFVDEEEAQSAIVRSARRRGGGAQTDGASAAAPRSRAVAGLNGHGIPGYDEMILSPDYTFDQFVVGPGNRLAHAAAQAVAQKPGESYNPYFIHGGPGLGKTHLLQAMCQTIMREFPDKRIYYVSCESFINQFMESVAEGEMLQFRTRFRNVDVLIIDDIHCLSQRDRTQEEFFHTFNTLYQAGRQIVLSSDAAPAEIPHLEERLVSRFSSGLVVHVDKPCYETRVAILKKKAALRELPLPDDVAAYVASAIDTNIRELEGAIKTLGMIATVAGRPIDLDMAREALGAARGGSEAAQQPTVQEIIEQVCEYYDVKLADLLSKRKYKSIAEPRQICMWLARTLTRYSLEEIGGYFGGRDHTTVLHAIKAIERKREMDDRITRDLAHLTSALSRQDLAAA
ncbi:MAG: chromosomal replication initiator protein DnaA [Phycisphaerales bacterium]|nr:chromosomal replication initiator protein DnaA [Phycisphaerales bacterium]